MKKAEKKIRSEYDLTGGVRGKHHKVMQDGYSIAVHHDDGTIEYREIASTGDAVIVLEPDLSPYFPDSETVNRALRCLVPLLPKRA